MSPRLESASAAPNTTALARGQAARARRLDDNVEARLADGLETRLQEYTEAKVASETAARRREHTSLRADLQAGHAKLTQQLATVLDMASAAPTLSAVRALVAGSVAGIKEQLDELAAKFTQLTQAQAALAATVNGCGERLSASERGVEEANAKMQQVQAQLAGVGANVEVHTAVARAGVQRSAPSTPPRPGPAAGAPPTPAAPAPTRGGSTTPASVGSERGAKRARGAAVEDDTPAAGEPGVATVNVGATPTAPKRRRKASNAPKSKAPAKARGKATTKATATASTTKATTKATTAKPSTTTKGKGPKGATKRKTPTKATAAKSATTPPAATATIKHGAKRTRRRRHAVTGACECF